MTDEPRNYRQEACFKFRNDLIAMFPNIDEDFEIEEGMEISLAVTLICRKIGMKVPPPDTILEDALNEVTTYMRDRQILYNLWLL